MGRIVLLIPYFGKFPNYFQLYLDSLAINVDILTVLFITDINVSNYILPENALVTYATMDETRERVRFFMKTRYNIILNKGDILKKNYKLCDFRPLYFTLFADKLDALMLTTADYVGWGDCDLIYGKLSNFISLDKENYSFIGIHGHFTALKYTPEMLSLYIKIDKLQELLLENEYCGVDELQFRKLLLDLLKEVGRKEFLVRKHFCDIIPNSNLTPTFAKGTNLTNLVFNKAKGLVYFLPDGTSRETFYVHLQKRRMQVNFTSHDGIFYIKNNSFEQSL
jgi:hypothetical protein